MSSKINSMVRPISVYTEFLQTEISQPKVLATGHCHNRFLCHAMGPQCSENVQSFCYFSEIINFISQLTNQRAKNYLN